MIAISKVEFKVKLRLVIDQTADIAYLCTLGANVLVANNRGVHLMVAVGFAKDRAKKLGRLQDRDRWQSIFDDIKRAAATTVVGLTG